MTLARSKPLKWTPRGVSDTLDSTNTFNGAMTALANLIVDPTTEGLWVCRPASAQITAFAGFNTPTFISALLVVGTRIYGMIASAATANHDEPFCYDTVTGAFVPIANVLDVNTPISPAAVGAWVPPTMALVGRYVVVTHPGFTGGVGGRFFGWIDTLDPNAFVWDSGNTAGNALSAVPVAVSQFFGRAYFAVNNAVEFTDPLDPLTRTNANQTLILGDNLAVSALGGLPLNNLSGGIVQALLAFKGVSCLFQITGDAALGTLAQNRLNVPTGTLAPNTVCATSKGLAFMAPDGLRIVDFSCNVSNPVGAHGEGVSAPFIYSLVPSRMAAACNGDTLRISTQNGLATGAPNQEFWFDFTRQKWSGPHTFPASLIAPYVGSFVLTPLGVTGKLFQSDIEQAFGSAYIENGVQMTFSFVTPMLPDTDQMCECAIVEATIDLAYSAAVPSYLATAFDVDGVVYDSLTLASGATPTVWGQFNWGQAVWYGAPQSLAPRLLSWHQALVFRRIGFSVTGNSSRDFKIGTLRTRYEMLGYLQMTG